MVCARTIRWFHSGHGPSIDSPSASGGGYTHTAPPPAGGSRHACAFAASSDSCTRLSSSAAVGRLAGSRSKHE
eukprot:4216470-Prymnesium_polylepis.2